MKKQVIICLLLLDLIRSASRAAGPQYLFDKFGPVDEATELPTPFTPLPEEEPVTGLFKSSTEPFFRDLNFSLHPRLYFRSLENSTGVNNTFAGGGSLGFTTGWWLDTLQLGVTGYTTINLSSNKDDIDRTGLVRSDGDGFSVLGQAWAKLKFGPVIGTFYRQELELPFIHGDDSRMIPNLFEAYQVEIEPSDIFRMSLGYVAQIKPRNSPDFIPMSEAAGAPHHVDRGTGFVTFGLGSEERTYLEGSVEVTFDLYSCEYLQAGHTWKFKPGIELRLDGQFADQRNVGESLIGDFSTQFYGSQLSASYQSAVLTFAHNYTAIGAGIIDPYGADPSFTGLMLSNFLSPGENAFLVGISYNFEKIGIPGVSAFANYVYGDQRGGNWRHEFNVTVDYRINKGPLKNLWLRLRYANLESSGQVPATDFRAIANYSFRF